MRILHKSKRVVAPLPQVAELIDRLINTTNDDLHEVLSQIDSWKWPRSDLNAWMKVLNKFDAILEEAIRDYDIDNLQVNVFTPLTKKTVCEILRFERLLLENSTNRKTFNSYDRLNSLMFSSDLDVLILALNLLLRPAQQYSSQPAVSHALSISTPRLASLAKRWPNLRDYDLNLVDLVTNKGRAQVEALPTEAREVNFVFYRQASSSSTAGKEEKKESIVEGDVSSSAAVQTPRKPTSSAAATSANASTSSGAVTIHIDSKTIESKPAMDILADAIEAYHVPDSEKFELLMRIRGAQAMTHAWAADREKLVVVRLLATAIFGHTHSDSQAQSSLFLYEPDLITHIAELLQLDRGVDIQVQTAAVAALDAMSRYRSKIQDVLTAVNAGVNHGILMALLRKTVADVAQSTSTLPQAFVEALFSFITFLATHASGGSMIVGAGLIPVLIQAIENRLPNRLYVVSKTMQLLDNVLYGYTNAFTLFCNARGVDILVDRIEYEVDLDIEECANDGAPNDAVAPYGKLSVARTAVLKHTLRSIHRMMQSSGTAEGLRGLLDSSLLKSVKKIMQHRAIFGPSALALAINIMAIFVHNEPTCLPVIQEAGLPEVFYSVIEKGLEPVIEVIQSVPNALGALCLNQAGQDQLTARPNTIPSLFSIFTSEDHQRVLQEKENAVLIGTSVEELIRHHPTLKEKVFVAIKSTMARIEELGTSYSVPDDIKHWYRLQPQNPAPAPAGAESTGENVAMEVDHSTPATEQATLPASLPPSGEQPSHRDDFWGRSHDNLIISYIDVFGKFLEGFFQHVPHCRDFVADTDGLNGLAKLTTLPCLPYDFANSVASDSFVQVVRTMAEAATNETLAFLVRLVQESLAECKDFWGSLDEQPKLLGLVEFSAGAEEEKANTQFRNLITLHTRVSLLSDIYATAGYSHGRATQTLLQSLLGKTPNPLQELGALHRACVWENIILKSILSAQGIDASPQHDLLALFGSASTPTQGVLSSTLSATTTATANTSSTSAANGASASASTAAANGATPTSATNANGATPAEPSASTSTPSANAKKEEQPRDKNAKGVKHLVGQIPSALAPFFQSIVRLFQTRRGSDMAQKQKIKEAAGIIADVLVKHLEQKSFSDKLSLFSYYTSMLNAATILLVDEKPSQKSLHTMLLVAFVRVGGLDALFGLCREFINTIEMVSKVKVDERTEVTKQELSHAFSGLKVALQLIQPTISAKPLFDATQTALALTVDKKDTDADYFEPHNFLVRMRAAALPVVRSIWEAEWLPSAPISVSKLVVHIVMELLNAENEEVKDVQTSASIIGGGPIGMPRIPPMQSPDENRIRQLTDMGFPRSAAERALTRTRNNVNAATELLLSHPYPFPPDPDPAPEPAPAAAEGEAVAVPAGDQDQIQADTPDAAPAEAGDAPAEAPASEDNVESGDAAETAQGDATEETMEETSSTASDSEAPAAPAPEEVSAPPGKTSEEWVMELTAAREPLKEGIGRRVLSLVDEHPSLVFDVQKVFIGPTSEYRTQAVKALIDDIQAFLPSAYDVQEQPLSVRCHLLALVLGEPSSPAAQMPEKEAETLLNVLLSLLLSNPGEGGQPTLPKWLSAQLLVIESLLVLGDSPRSVTLPKENEPINREPIAQGPRYAEARNTLFDFSMRLLGVPTLPKDEMISVLRLIVLLTRDHNIAEAFMERNGVAALFQYLRISSGTQSGTGIQSYIALIVRHIVENQITLQHVMRQEVKRYFSHPRSRNVDIGSFVSGCSSTALRDPEAFVKVAEEMCTLSQPFSPMKTVSLKPEVEPNATFQHAIPGGNKSNEMQIDEAPVQQASGAPVESTETLIHYLIGELMKTVKTDMAPENLSAATSVDTGKLTSTHTPASSENRTDAAQPSSTELRSPQDPVDYTYPCFIMQVLTELLFSYESCKIAFLSYTPKKRNQTPAKEGGLKHRTAAIQFLLSDLMTFGTINPQPPSEARKQITLCNWAMSVIVALCVDTVTNQDLKDVPTDLISVRKFVLEAISRALKDLPSSDSPELRYGRLLALSDLCHRLLTVRFNVNGKKAGDEVPTHIAKVMLEKNFVATLTNVLSEVDLNYPNIRNVVSSVLRPLEYLTKIAMKMSRVSDKNKEVLEEKQAMSESDISEEDEDEDDETESPETEEASQLYRNSSLGLFGGEMEDVHYGDEDDMDEEDDEDEDGDVEMDFGDETGSEDTSATDEEDVEEDLEDETGESEEGWQEEDEEDEEGLVENEGQAAEEEADEDDEDEGEEVMWQDIAVGDGGADEGADEGEEEEDVGDMPMAPMDMDDEGDVISEGEEFADELGLVDEARLGHGPNLFDLAAGFANVLGGSLAAGIHGAPDGEPVVWTGAVRSTRRRGAGDDDLDIFGRSRNPPAPSAENVTHPLLLDPATAAARASQARSSRRGHRGLLAGSGVDIDQALGEGATQFLQQMLTHGRAGGHEALHINLPAGLLANFPRNGRGGAISASIRLERAPRPTDGRTEGRSLEPLLTIQRWSEEVKMLHGKFEQARLSRLHNHVVLALLPAAAEAYKKAKEAEEREQERIREEQVRAAEEAAKKEQEAIEAAERAKAEEEARAVEAAAQAAVEAEAAAAAQESAAAADTDVEMADDSPSAETPAAENGPQTAESSNRPEEAAAPAQERVTVMIHGAPVDITDTGIDPTFLEALPDEMREEVLNQHVRDQRAAQLERPADSAISAEFLDALPPDIRAEIIQQEAAERAQRTRAEQATQQGGPLDIDPADFIASLDPQLRQVVLMDSDDVFIQSLPSHMIAEANIHREPGRPPRPRQVPPRQGGAQGAPQQASQPTKAPQSREAIQLLDKSALAALVRLLFYPHILKKNLLYKVLVNLCENAKSRTDLFNLLLSILQDGSGDLASIDKSFAQMSVRHSRPTAPQTPKAIGKQRVSTDYFGSLSLPQNDVVPELIVQRCLEALTYIVSSNELSSLFFLTEHELPIGLRRSSSKKGKGKEKQAPQTHYPIVLLLGLLDRPSILRTPSIVESVVGLLATVTRPLASLKDKDSKKSENAESSTAGASTASPGEQPSSGAQPVDNTQSVIVPDTASFDPAPAPTPASAAVPATAQGESPQKPPASVEEKVLLANPPHIPHHVLRLIVNVLTAGECSGRTFMQSLALIQHLSYIPDAREVIASELRSRAQEFGQSLFAALDELAVALRDADVQPDVLATTIAAMFSSASSDQAKLLRVLKTIDYMYSPKTSGNSTEADIEKVQSIYETFRFSPLWKRLGDCLSIIEEKPEMEHIATVLLPLIESLMVVCKYVGPKTTSGATARALRASTSPRSPTSARESMEDLFVTFTDAHRKVLNLMVRNNPSLMSGSFSLLVHNPRVLDFDNKRNYFNQQLHRRPHSREHHSTLQLNVRRQRVFEDSFQYLQRKTGEQIKYGKLSVRFYDEEGVDAGGVTREWFQILARQMFDPNYALFQPCAADKLTYQPNRASWVNPEHLSFFKFVGRVIGKAIYDGRLLDAYFARSLYRQLLGKQVDYKDVEWVDPEYYNSLCWILENDPSPLDLTFSVEADEFGVTKLVELKEGGASIPVTQENRKEFVQLSANYRLYSSIKDQIESLLAGFYEIIPKDLVSIFNEQELELLISGTPDIDVDEWRSATEYNGYTSSDPVIVWFWRALKSFNREERAKVLSFATGTSRVPLGGFVELQGVQGTQRFSIHKAYGDTDRLPQAHTCFNQIDLPQYSSYEMLRQQLLLAINEGGEGFGFA
ncbi:hypothetical protein BD310DRAFT_1041405 [Dichomitus squalens]|uniref:HECT-type E3 ubiquitin transferase n=1 Tax=Dichomitus squalens TaxID=114155 RepID=A0A4Q9PLQ2_9APHY|nr:hypothetical protein BD310DRAFT_1041405 [Dichomitus squalens]